jgi:serine/threonine protein kinase
MNEETVSSEESEFDRVFDDMLLRVERGAEVDREQLVARFPDRVSEIDDLLAVAQNIDRLRHTEWQPEIDGYRILRSIGQGGMGVVYLAEQDALQRKVALKTLASPGLTHPGARVRFAREIQVVARLKHPHIIPIYEVGEADNLPFFTMEFVEGTNLSALLTELALLQVPPSQLTWRHLRQAFHKVTEEEYRGPDEGYYRWVCRVVRDAALALDHAHRQGVIHRDVKPSNLMLTPEGRILLFDFGVARLRSEQTLTASGEFIGTPAYMSPEVIQKGSANVDVRTDVYSLGATLYELLTLRTPFDGETSRQVIENILSREPASPRRFNSEIPRDLESICLTALAKETHRRYADTTEFAADIDRFFEFRPIRARRPSTLGRSLRLLRRNRSKATIGLLLLLLLIGTPTALWWQERRATAEIEEEADRVRRMNAFLRKILDASDPLYLGPNTPAAALLQTAALDLPDLFAVDPEMALDLTHSIGESYHGLGLFEDAVEISRAALQSSASLGEDHPLRLLTCQLLGRSLRRIPHHEEAEHWLTLAFEGLSRVRGPEHPETLSALRDLAVVRFDRGQLRQAVADMRQAFEQLSTPAERPSKPALGAVISLVGFLIETGRLEDAETLAQENFPYLSEVLGDRSVAYFEGIRVQSRLFAETGRREQAEESLRDAIELHEATLVRPTPTLVELRRQLSSFLLAWGRNHEAIEMGEENIALAREAFGATHPETLAVRGEVAYAKALLGRAEEALAELQEVLEINVATYGEDHRSSILIKNNLASAYDWLGQSDRAEQMNREILEHRRRALGSDHPETVVSLANLATALDRQSRHEEAQEYYAEVILSAEEVLPPIQYAQILTGYAVCMYRLGELSEAEDLLEEARVILEEMKVEAHEPHWKFHRQVVDAVNQAREQESSNPGSVNQ